MGHFVQVGGALLVLVAFALAQARAVTPQARVYLILNFVGASVLGVDAYIERQWGFLLLEGAWAIIAAWGLARPGGGGLARAAPAPTSGRGREVAEENLRHAAGLRPALELEREPEGDLHPAVDLARPGDLGAQPDARADGYG